MNGASFKDRSKENLRPSDGKTTIEAVYAGCLQRIADAQEAMAKPYLKLLHDVEYLTSLNKQKNATIERLTNSNKTLKGHITRLKNKEKEKEVDNG